MKFSSPFALSISLFLFINSSAQKTPGNTDIIAGLFKTVVLNSQKEKIIVQTDRKIYIAGEKIWFKVFVVNAINKKPDLSEKNLFTDLVDDHDSVIAKLVLDNRQLNTSGAFTLPDSLKSGFYWLRSYTAKLLAEDTESIFIQPVYVLNKRLHDAGSYSARYTSSVNKGKSFSPVTHFFPERLTGIPGIISTGVLQVIDANNNPLHISGDLLNSNDSVITRFTTNHFGLAQLTFLYDPAQKYIVVMHVNGNEIKYALPPIDNTAAQLSFANQTAKSIKAFVTLEDSLASDMQTTILGVHGDSLCYAALGSGTFGIKIPLDNFPGGISSFLLFDQQQHLLAEREIFISKDNYKLDIKPNKKNYRARDNATLNINMSDADGYPLETSLDVSVQDEWVAQLSDSIEINNLPPSDDLLLNNWLSLYHDNYSTEDINMLMMTATALYNISTHVDSTNQQLRYDDNEKLLNLVGKITNKKDVPVKDRVVTVMSKNESAFFIDFDTTKDDGAFKIPLPQNMDSLSLSLQVMDKHSAIRTDDNITLDTFNFPQVATPLALKQQFLAYNINMLASLRKYHIDAAITFQGKGWLTPVTVKTVAKAEPNYDVTKRINSISQILTSDKFRYGGYGAIGNAILTVPGVSNAYGDITIFGKGIAKPLILIDGVESPITSGGGVGPDGPIMNFLNSLSPADIDFIEVLRGGEAGIYGMRGADGVISINSKHGPGKIDYSKTNFKTYTPLTYHVSPQFFVPDYSNPQIKNNPLPDPRTTIYWTGNVITDSTGKATVNFYTADNATNYTVTATGLSVKGDLIYKRITIRRN